MFIILKEEQVTIQRLDHLGLIAATIDRVGLIAKIDKRIPVNHKMGAILTVGERLAAMIYNGLGFMDDRLYMFPEFLRDKPVDRLFSSKVTADFFNDDSLGRCLDLIAKYGGTRLFSEVALEIGIEQGLFGKTVHLDSTSLSVFGEYANSQNSDFHITYGYSKDGRPDLKQMLLHLATTGAAAFPIWMESHSGNASDKIKLQQVASRMQQFCKQIKAAPQFICVMDSAGYENCSKKAANLLWLSRVPSYFLTAKKRLQAPKESFCWIQLDRGYHIASISSDHGKAKERWVLVSSQQAYKRDVSSLDKNIIKEHEAITKKLKLIGHDIFTCEADALKLLKPLKRKLKYHNIDVKIKVATKYSATGRPKKGVVAKVVGCVIKATLCRNEEKISFCQNTCGRFILATNQLDKAVLSDSDMLLEYKNQNKTERSFRFIKGNAFEVSSVFLKKPQRIRALSMVMSECLSIYGLAEYFLRETLKQYNDSVPNQIKKPTQRPTMAWICRMFHGVNVLYVRFKKHTERLIVGVTDVLKKIVTYFGKRAEEIYNVHSAQP